ncbi:MAG: tRNA pseudouridine(55) synthase TruB [Bacteroidota bacterium]
MKKDKPPKSGYNFKAGEALLINKPKGWTSFDVVNKLRYQLKHSLQVKKIKVGHAGTLDPMATGLLIICTGKFTKKIDEYQHLPKVYTGTIVLGGTTPSYDTETEVDDTFPTDHINEELIEQARQQFLGPIKQIPPMFSAIKIDGQPLYKKARKGIKMEVKARDIHIYEVNWQAIRMPELDFEMKCSKGTYVRSFAHDFGKAVRSGAYLSALCRTQIGEYHLDDAWELDQLVAYIKENITPLTSPDA